tara:strand:- start:1047 stop:1793 length:747 start_codon:yes stop_codon:yes gene_type:complete
MSIGYYYINLDKSKTRNELMEKNKDLYNIDLQRINGVDGTKIEELNKHFNIINCKKKYQRQLGCLASHILSIKNFLNSNNQYALILEDDVSFDIIKDNNLNLDKTLNYLINIAPEFGILQLSYIWGSKVPFIKNKNNLFLKWKKYYSACSYLITKKGAEEILNKFTLDSNNKIIIDLNLYSMKTYVADNLLYSRTKTYVLKFSLFFQRALDSTISSNKKTHQKAKKILLEVLDSYKNQIKEIKLKIEN